MCLSLLSCHDIKSVDASLNHAILIKDVLRLAKLFESVFHGKTGKLPLYDSCKPDKSAHVKKTDRLVGFSAFQHFKAVFEKLRFSHIKVLFGIRDFRDMGKKKLNQLPVIFGSHLLSKEQPIGFNTRRSSAAS